MFTVEVQRNGEEEPKAVSKFKYFLFKEYRAKANAYLLNQCLDTNINQLNSMSIYEYTDLTRNSIHR